MKDARLAANISQERKAKAYGGMCRSEGGKAHSDAKEDRSLVKQMVKPAALTGRATGGAAKKKAPKTQVNVVVAPRSGQAVPVAAGQAPGAVRGPSLSSAPAAPVANPSTQGGGLAALQGIRPVPAKKGGAIKRELGGKVQKVTGYRAGSESGEGRLERAEHMRKGKK